MQSILVLSTLIIMIGAALTLAQSEHTTAPSVAGNRYLYVSSYNSHEVHRYHTNGTFIDVFISAESGGLRQPHGILDRGTDVLVCSFATHQVLRYSKTTGAFLDVFIGPTAGGLAQPTYLVERGAHLYVSSQGSDQIQRYDATTGAFVDNFASGGGLDGPSGFAFSPDGMWLYVSSRFSGQGLAYIAATGAFDHVCGFSSAFTAGNSFGLNWVRSDLWGASNNQVLRLRVNPGGVLATVNSYGVGIEQGPGGMVYFARGGSNQIGVIDPDSNTISNAQFLQGSASPSSLNFVNFFHFTRGTDISAAATTSTTTTSPSSSGGSTPQPIVMTGSPSTSSSSSTSHSVCLAFVTILVFFLATAV